MCFEAIDPASGAMIATYPSASAEEARTLLQRCHDAHVVWATQTVAKRAALLTDLARVLRERAGPLSELMTREMGKPITQAAGEVEKCAWLCEYYAQHATSQLAPVAAATDATRSYWTPRPLGVILGIMPWNFPLWQAIRYAVPALTAGNGAVLKHAPNVPGSAAAMEDLFRAAGYPEGLFVNVFADLETTGALIDDALVRGVSLTGSVGAGRVVAERAGKGLKKCVLELGGSDPSIVLADADLDLAVASCVQSRLLNGGQSCIAAKRFIVVDAVRDDFEAMVTQRFANTIMGDPMDPASDIGPMARRDLRDGLHEQVGRAVAAGARLVLGGVIPDRAGWWYPPTLLTDVAPGNPAHDEELFGPVASIVPARDESEAIRVANDTTFGLGASIYTRDVERGEHLAVGAVHAGNCFVNGMVKSDPRLPFGGIKDSGFGRELSPLGILEFTNSKTIWVR
jgi:succinate-semialdehyde dehydrogenase/glutarate-semialdehyde dehydrogenase